MKIKNEPYVNKDVIARFKRLESSGRLAHAYLFLGPEGVGKFSTAVKIAEHAIGKGDKSDEAKIRNDNHPDVHIIRSNRGETIKIDQVRELTAATQLKPYEAEYKFFIIQNIENLTPEGANALLKTLEEPPSNSRIILTTSVPERVFSTVLSRCHVIYFAPCSRKVMDKYLKGEGVAQQDADFLGMYTAGCPDKARGLYEEGFLDRKNEIIDQMIFTAGSENYIKKIASDKELTKELLDVLLSWHRDMLLIKSGVSEDQLIHLDRIEKLRETAEKKSFDEIQNIINEIVRASKQLGDNLNVKVSLMVIKEQVWAN